MNYNNGKIYTIRSFQTDKYYIGSSCSPLYKRFYEHKLSYDRYLNSKYPYTTSFEIIQYPDCYIELLELYPCSSKSELEQREGQLIREHKDNIVNKFIAGRTDKQYREENKNIIKAKKMQYYNNNKDKLNKKCICICGGKYIHSSKSHHEKTKKHINYIMCYENALDKPLVNTTKMIYNNYIKKCKLLNFII